MTAPGGERSPVGTFEHTLQITTGLGPNLQAILDRGATSGKGWFIQAGGDFAPGSAQVDGVVGATAFSYHAWDVWYVSVNKNANEIANWDSGVTEIDGMTSGLAAANLGKIDVNYLLNTKELLDRYIRWLAASHETLFQWAGRIGAGDSQFRGLAAHVIANRVIQLGQTVDSLHRQLTIEKSPPPSQAMQLNADALVRFGREMSELWNEYSGTLHTAVETAMNAVVNNIYKYIVGMGLDRATSNPYVLDTLAGDSRNRAEAYIRSVIAGYHSDVNSAPEFNREVRPIAARNFNDFVVSESGETRTFERGVLPEGMESFGGPLDSQATWDLINTRITDYVRKVMTPLNERSVELLNNLADSYSGSKSSLVEITQPDTQPGDEHNGNAGGGGGNNGTDGNGANGNTNTNQQPPPAAGGGDQSDGQGNQAFGEPPGAADGSEQTGGPLPQGEGNGPAVNGNGEVNFVTPGGENGVNVFSNGNDASGSGAGNEDGSGNGTFGANGDPNGQGTRSFMPPPFMPPGGSFGSTNASGVSRTGLVPPGVRSRLPGSGSNDDEAEGFADQPSFGPEQEEDAADPGGLNFQNLAPDTANGIAEAAVSDSDALLADQLAGGGSPDGAVHVPGLTDKGVWNGGDFDALFERDLDFADAAGTADGAEVVLPAGGVLGAPGLSEGVFPGGGLDGEALGLGPENTPIHAFDGQGWSEWSEDMPDQQVGDGTGGVGGERDPRMPMMPMMPPLTRANQGENEERQRLTWLSEDPDVWGTRSDVGIGILGLPQETAGELEEQGVSPHVYEPVAVPRGASVGDASWTKEDVEQEAAGNERRGQA